LGPFFEKKEEKMACSFKEVTEQYATGHLVKSRVNISFESLSEDINKSSSGDISKSMLSNKQGYFKKSFLKISYCPLSQ